MRTSIRNTILGALCIVAFSTALDVEARMIKMAPWYLQVRLDHGLNNPKYIKWNMMYQFPDARTCHEYAKYQWNAFYQIAANDGEVAAFSTMCFANDHGKEYFHTMTCTKEGICDIKGGTKG